MVETSLIDIDRECNGLASTALTSYGSATYIAGAVGGFGWDDENGYGCGNIFLALEFLKHLYEREYRSIHTILGVE